MPENPSAAQHTLVAGPTAWTVATWIRRVFPIGFVILGAVGLTLIVDRLVPQIDLSRHMDVAFVLLGIVLVPLGILTLLSRLRSNAEQDAGYTTVPGTRIDLDLVHPVTGATVRRAGDRELTGAEWRAVLAGEQLNRHITPAGTTGTPRFVAQRDLFRIIPVVVALIAGAVYVGFLIAGLLSPDPDRVERASRDIVIALVITGLSVAGVGIYWFVQRGRESSVQRRRPGAAVFTSQRVDELRQLIGRTHEDVAVPWTFPIAITEDGIEFWPDATAKRPAVTLPWGEIREVYPGRATSTYGSRSSDVNAVRLRMGTTAEPVDMPIGIGGRVQKANAALDAIARHARVVAAL